MDAHADQHDSLHGNPYRDATDPRAATVETWQEQGWTAAFSTLPGGVIACPDCEAGHAAGSFRVDHQGRAEGMSDPEDEELFLALTCAECGCRGTLTLGYGPTAGAQHADVIRLLPPARRR